VAPGAFRGLKGKAFLCMIDVTYLPNVTSGGVQYYSNYLKQKKALTVAWLHISMYNIATMDEFNAICHIQQNLPNIFHTPKVSWVALYEFFQIYGAELHVDAFDVTIFQRLEFQNLHKILAVILDK
jgi:hypothetical protein